MSKNTTRNKNIPSAWSEDELALLDKVIAGTGISRSAFIRAATMRQARKLKSRDGVVRLHLEAMQEAAS